LGSRLPHREQTFALEGHDGLGHIGGGQIDEYEWQRHRVWKDCVDTDDSLNPALKQLRRVSRLCAAIPTARNHQVPFGAQKSFDTGDNPRCPRVAKVRCDQCDHVGAPCP